MRLAALGVSCRQLTALFVTHHHSDHLVALPDVALTRWIARDANLDDAPLVVVAPEGPSARFAERMLEPWADDIAARIEQTGRSTVPQVQCLPFTVTSEAAEVWRDGLAAYTRPRLPNAPKHSRVRNAGSKTMIQLDLCGRLQQKQYAGNGTFDRSGTRKLAFFAGSGLFRFV